MSCVRGAVDLMLQKVAERERVYNNKIANIHYRTDIQF